ncbi:hypothetical protein ILYODFUR_036891 [Ilyodon furcidens]|uniref:Uncharacterized protein n=1 Tax=Ilyodon furcidens TaxID=33524 RepID=A0ABV0UQ11_9TELE
MLSGSNKTLYESISPFSGCCLLYNYERKKGLKFCVFLFHSYSAPNQKCRIAQNIPSLDYSTPHDSSQRPIPRPAALKPLCAYFNMCYQQLLSSPSVYKRDQ